MHCFNLGASYRPIKTVHFELWLLVTVEPHRIFYLHFQNALTNFHDFRTLQHRSILNPTVDSIFIKYIIQYGVTWLNLTTWIPLSVNA